MPRVSDLRIHTPVTLSLDHPVFRINTSPINITRFEFENVFESRDFLSSECTEEDSSYVNRVPNVTPHSLYSV